MTKFINRYEEREFLESEFNRSSSSLVILYGRRRVGKTALVSNFMIGKSSIYFLATEESEAQNRTAFKDMVANFTENTLLKNTTAYSWDIIFQVLADYKPHEKKLIAIDEFQYLGKSNPAFPSIFQKIWDTILKDKNIMVILCGSLVSMMESQTLNYTSPLYGRRTGQIKLKQIPFEYYSEFFPDKSRREMIEYYSVTGGVPKYIELFYDSDNIYTAIQKNVISKSSFLYSEPNFLLQQEVAEIGSYFSIIKTIAAGNQKLSKIAGALELKQTGLSKYLKTLTDLGVLEREVPITEKNPEKSKRGLYKIKDNFILFWFKFIYPNLSYIESGNEEIAMQKIRENLSDNHISYVYEDVCIEKMWSLNAQNKWSFHFDKVGRWWNNNTEIDIVAVDTAGVDIVFGECKYLKSPIGMDTLKSLEQKSKSVEWNNNNRRNYYILFSMNGFKDELLKEAEKREDLLLME